MYNKAQHSCMLSDTQQMPKSFKPVRHCVPWYPIMSSSKTVALFTLALASFKGALAALRLNSPNNIAVYWGKYHAKRIICAITDMTSQVRTPLGNLPVHMFNNVCHITAGVSLTIHWVRKQQLTIPPISCAATDIDVLPQQALTSLEFH